MEQLTINNVSKQYGHRKILDNLSFQLAPAKIYGLLGRNGAGKSTLAHLLTGTDRDYTGQIMVDEPVSYVAQIAPTFDQSGGQAMLTRIRQALSARPTILILDEPSSNLDETHQQWLINQL